MSVSCIYTVLYLFSNKKTWPSISHREPSTTQTQNKTRQNYYAILSLTVLKTRGFLYNSLTEEQHQARCMYITHIYVPLFIFDL
jgi:hypothetical protein